jgi:putative phosphoesterase
MRVGVISDTHGLLRPQAVAALRTCAALIHAGDIGSPDVLAELQALAPVTAVRGNNDVDNWSRDIPEQVTFELGGVRIHLLHDLKQLAIDVVAERVNVVIAGHSHSPLIDRRAGVLYFNPGSAGPRRFKLPIALGILEIGRGDVDGQIIELGKL